MITSSSLVLFLGVFCIYNTSKKAVLHSNIAIEKWLQSNTKQAKIIGVSCILLSFLSIIFTIKSTSGIFYWLLLFITILSFVIILAPLQMITYKHVSILFLLIFVFELLF